MTKSFEKTQSRRQCKKPTIEECFFRTEEGKCGSPEIYRFNPHVEKTGRCAYNAESPAFVNGKLLCLEFRAEDDSEKGRRRGH